MSVAPPSNSRRRRRFVVTAVAVGSLVLTGCSQGGGGGTGESARNESLSFATGGTGGVYYPYGGGIANAISKDLPGVTVTVQETNASVDNMKLLQSEQAQLALSVGDVVSDAVNGENDFTEKLEICSLGNLYNNFTHIFSTKAKGVTAVEQMQGKRISVGAPGSATEVIADRILEAAGLDPKADIQRQQLGVAESVDALKDGTIDAAFWSGGLPTAAIVDLASTGDLVLIDSGKYADTMAQKYGDFYFPADIPAGTYQGQTQDSSSVVSPNILVVRQDMDQQLQQDITKAIFENKEQLVTVHPAAKELDPKTAAEVGFVETCPGAKAYYDSVQ